MGIRLMIIKLMKYNEIGELLEGSRTTGSQAQVSYWDRVWEAPITMEAVCMGVEETGMQTRHRGAYNRPPSQNRDQGCCHNLFSELSPICPPQLPSVGLLPSGQEPTRCTQIISSHTQ